MANGTVESSIKRWLVAIPILSLILGGLGAWGVNQRKEGDRERRILDLEREIKELREQTVTRHEMTQFMDSTTEGIQGIRADIRELRNKR